MLLVLCCFSVSPGPPGALKCVPLVGWDFPQAGDDLLPSLHVRATQAAIAEWAAGSGLLPSLKRPVNVSKSLCTHRVVLMSPQFFLNIFSCLLWTKIFGAGTVSYLCLCSRAGFCRWCVCTADSALLLSLLGATCSAAPASCLWTRPPSHCTASIAVCAWVLCSSNSSVI